MSVPSNAIKVSYSPAHRELSIELTPLWEFLGGGGGGIGKNGGYFGLGMGPVVGPW